MSASNDFRAKNKLKNLEGLIIDQEWVVLMRQTMYVTNLFEINVILVKVRRE